MDAGLRVLVVDNDDSFVHILCDYLTQLGAHVQVRRSRDLTLGDIPGVLDEADAVLVSPGPGTPADAGASLEVIAEAARRAMPLLGVCLGHQALAEAFGGVVDTAPELLHGKTSRVVHDATGVLEGLPQPFTVGRYHSLAILEQTLPDVLQVTARVESADADGVIMAIAHRDLPLHGVQFHPESVLTEGGHRLLANWLALAGSSDAIERSRDLHPLIGPA